MDWLKKLIEKHTKDGVLDMEILMKDVNKEFPKYAVPKDQYNTLSETKKKLEQDLSDRDKQLEDLKKIDAEGLEAKIEVLQNENKAAKEKYEADMKELTLTNAIKLAIAGKVHDESIVSGLIDKSKLIVGDDGQIVGLEEQLTSLKESKAFLFKTDDQNNNQQQKPGFKVGNPPQENNNPDINAQISAAFGNTKKG